MAVLYPHLQTSPYLPLFLSSSVPLPIHFIFAFLTHVYLVSHLYVSPNLSATECSRSSLSDHKIQLYMVSVKYSVVMVTMQNWAGVLLTFTGLKTPTLNLDQVAERGWALWRCQIGEKYHRVLSGLTRQALWCLMSWTSTNMDITLCEVCQRCIVAQSLYIY